MKAYKRTRIIASLAILSSLAVGGTAAAATNTPITNGTPHLRNYMRTAGDPTTGSNTATVTLRTRKARKPHIVGTITSVSGSSFTITAKVWNRPSSPVATPASPGTKIKPTFSDKTYTVNTASNTVFMKDGKLDSLSDLAVGQLAMISGTLDSAGNTVAATGVHIVTKKK